MKRKAQQSTARVTKQLASPNKIKEMSERTARLWDEQEVMRETARHVYRMQRQKGLSHQQALTAVINFLLSTLAR